MGSDTDKYESKIPGWSSFSARTKFILLSRRQSERKRAADKRRQYYKHKPPIVFPEGYVTVKEIREKFGVCRSTVERWIESGEVKKANHGRNVAYCLEDVERVSVEFHERRHSHRGI